MNTKDQLIEELLTQCYISENLYKRMEEEMPCEPMDDGMLERMNKAIGFSKHPKDRDYRPYCVHPRCDRMPRMMRCKEGFCCWNCGNVWDLTLNNEQPCQESKSAN